MRISDLSADVCSSDLDAVRQRPVGKRRVPDGREIEEIAAVQRDAVAMVARSPAELGRRDQAAAFGEGTAFGAHEAKLDAVRDPDRKSVGEGKSVSVRVDIGGRSVITKKNTTQC